MKVGVEVGGTFTDLVALDGDHIQVIKVPSTPHAPEVGVLNALRAAQLDFSHIEDLAHGSTVATNAVLERKGGLVAFITTQGFRDILFLQRHNRKSIYDLYYKKPEPPVRRRDCFEIRERMLADGSVEQALDERAIIETLVPALRQQKYDAVAICLLNSYVNPVHEQRLAACLKEALPSTVITCSHQVAREFREFERASTTTLSAYVQPVISGYLGRLTQQLEAGGFRGRFSVMQSNGGRLPAGAMRENAIAALFSGPAAGVVGAVRQIMRSGYRDAITFDMGGTSSDVCLVDDGVPVLASETEIDGLPIRTPVLDIVTVGAGGGSLIWLDDGGMLRVGPQSAGAQPGPACYGRGGTLPTITDAHVILGTVRPQAFLGGEMQIDVASAELAFASLADHFKLPIETVAFNAVRLANANIVRAIQLVSTERGRDPRDFVLVPYGGAGPMQAAQIAEELGISRVVAPPNPGVTSAYGLLASNYTKYETITDRRLLDDTASDGLRDRFAEMRARITEQFALMGFNETLEYSYTLEMRFVGQAFEVPVSLTDEELHCLDLYKLAALFADAHQRIYFHSDKSQRPIEVVALRIGATIKTGEVPSSAARHASSASEKDGAPLFDGTSWVPCDRRLLAMLTAESGTKLHGPAVLEDYTTTVHVPLGWYASIDEHSNLLLSKESQNAS